MSKLLKEKVEVQCTRPDPLPDGTHCDYIWSTRSPLGTVSCPSCRYPNNKAKAILRAQEAKKKAAGTTDGPNTPATN